MKRDPFFDNAKVLLMILVVFGHILDIGVQTKFNIVTYEWIYSFHMPLFVFISGYFTRLKDADKFRESIIKFAETLIVFTLIHVITSFIIGDLTVNLYQILIIPRWTLWYLLSLIWWRLMLFLTPSSIRENHKVLIFLSIILCLTMGWIPVDSLFSFQRTFAFLPFFTIRYVAGTNNIDIKTNKRGSFLCFLFLTAIALLYFIIPKINYGILTQSHSYFQDSLSSGFDNFALRVAWLFLASCMAYCFLSIVPRKEYCWTHFGHLTLFIYMYHSVILLWRFVLRDEFHLPSNLFFLVLYTVFVLGIIWLMSKVKFFHRLLNPISSTKKYRI